MHMVALGLNRWFCRTFDRFIEASMSASRPILLAYIADGWSGVVFAQQLLKYENGAMHRRTTRTKKEFVL